MRRAVPKMKTVQADRRPMRERPGVSSNDFDRERGGRGALFFPAWRAGTGRASHSARNLLASTAESDCGSPPEARGSSVVGAWRAAPQ
eukprot:7690716-Pyramimonas_sp.AAC.1